MTRSRYSGPKLRDVLDEQGRRQDWLAEQIEMDRSYLSKVLRGERQFTHGYAVKAARALQIPVHLLAADPHTEPPSREEAERVVPARSK